MTNADPQQTMHHATTVVVRPGKPTDADAIADIYNEGIRGRTATFETAERSTSDIQSWFDGRLPLLVAERATSDGKLEVVGWVHASAYRARECYAGIGDFSVYVAGDARGTGVGDALMAEFLVACPRAGLWKIVSRIFPENTASRALCRRHGFREVGVYEKHAKLDSVWRDVVIVERLFRESQVT